MLTYTIYHFHPEYKKSVKNIREYIFILKTITFFVWKSDNLYK